ncbi:S-adenosyl-L-methionine-dependent methyltransferase [Pyrenophora tritici-repentis]|nr:S-adenosyl-L-methionine-dependent methyltransferase [Pyrenophora tritici-repentis]KAF7449018.1 S-adenosyl-L-methionine-dependent methyltransferase [Pyrenophora tritici-repentis]
MTHPTSVNMTFDTSLIDVKPPPPISNENTSFTSTTASDSTIDMGPPTKPVQHMHTQAAYNEWASIYDTDGNILQAIDDLELSSLLPGLLSSVSSSGGEGAGHEINILDLGCGTGRNTAKLLRYDWRGG